VFLALRTEHNVLSLGKNFKKKSLKHFPLLKKKTPTHEVLLYFFYTHDLIDRRVHPRTQMHSIFNLAIYREL